MPTNKSILITLIAVTSCFGIELQKRQKLTSKAYAAFFASFEPLIPESLSDDIVEETSEDQEIDLQRESQKEALGAFECPICHENFDQLAKHIRTHEVYSLKCAACTRSFPRKRTLATHIRLTHTSQYSELGLSMALFRCSECGLSCASNSNLTAHMRIHSGIKPYKCNLCDYASTQQNNLIRHTRTHTGQKPFKCDQCDYSCTTSSQLTIHMRSHTGEKPFECDQCNFSCSQKGTLTRHMSTHSTEKIFKCDQCGYSALRIDTLNRHKKRHKHNPDHEDSTSSLAQGTEDGHQF